MICVGVNHSVNRHQLMYKRKRHPEVEASQMPNLQAFRLSSGTRD